MAEITRQNKSKSIFAGCILILIAVLYALMSYWTPTALDDWSFMAEWRDVNGDSSLSATALFDFWKDIRLYDNGRLSNTFVPVALLYSPWKELFPIFTGILVALIVAFATYFSFGFFGSNDPKAVRSEGQLWFSPLKVTALWAAILYMLPWRNRIFVTDYSLNYIWAAAVSMLFMAVVTACEKRGWSIWRFVFCLVLAFFAGGWHEGFAVATLAGFMLFTIVRWGNFSAQWYIIGVFYAAVTAAFCICPGLLDRSSREFGEADLGFSLFKICIDFLPVTMLCGGLIIMALVPAMRKYVSKTWQNPWFVIGSGITIAGIALSLLFTHQPRSAFWPDLMAVVMIFILTRPLWNKLAESSANLYLSILGLVVCLVPMVYSLVWQKTLSDESEIILGKMENSESGTVFHDVISKSEIPAHTLRITSQGVWTTEFHYEALSNYFQKPYIAVIPTELEGIGLSELKEGKFEQINFDIGKAYKVGEAIVLPFALPRQTLSIEVTLQDGAHTDAIAFLLPFMSNSGDAMTYVCVYNLSASEIKSLKKH